MEQPIGDASGRAGSGNPPRVPPRRRRVYQSTETLWAAILSAAGGVAFAVFGLGGGRGAFVLYIAAVLMFLIAVRMPVVGIQVHADSVKVANLLYSRSFAWRDIDHFAMLPLFRYPYVGTVVLRDGRKYGTYGLSTSPGESESKQLRIQRPIDELNRILADRREAHPA
jgi:hypothetical protein